MHRRLTSAFSASTAAVLAGALLVTAPAATANPVTDLLVDSGVTMREPEAPAQPIWSGLDAYSLNATDESGELLSFTTLDSSVSLDSADRQYRYAYSTTNQHGESVVATSAVFLPSGEMPEGGYPVLAWAHGTVGTNDACTPSANPRGARDTEYLNHWLDEGYAIVAADYAGMGAPGTHSYLNGSVAAENVVDSVVASHSLLNDALSPSWAVIGQSQGGGTALHVAHEASALSQEAGLDYLGAVATGTPAYIEEIVNVSGPSFPPMPLTPYLNAYLVYIVAGVQEARPDLDIDSVLTDEGRRMIELSETSCLTEVAESLDGTNISRMFSAPLMSVVGLPEALGGYMATPTGGYDKPVFLGHGLLDQDVPSPIGVALNSEIWARQFLADNGGGNSSVEVHWYPTDHSDTVMESVPDSTPFLEDLFNQ
ncbi:lipase family protein [Corynebacterium sputi]|uniref:lipase family protein n=1 Tax=Corynebacterium sputi TaxID=489915 RepID=UPI000413BE91|nr:lipase family protein [Corynebacterium sputi]